LRIVIISSGITITAYIARVIARVSRFLAIKTTMA